MLDCATGVARRQISSTQYELRTCVYPTIICDCQPDNSVDVQHVNTLEEALTAVGQLLQNHLQSAQH